MHPDEQEQSKIAILYFPQVPQQFLEDFHQVRKFFTAIFIDQLIVSFLSTSGHFARKQIDFGILTVWVI